MIVIEDWSLFALGCYGNPIVQTPVVDSLAARGLRFDRAYCQGTVCNPSRASFCTGLRPDSLRVYGNGDAMDEHVPEGVPFFANLLQKKGNVFIAQSGKLVHKWDDAKRFADGFNLIEYTKQYDYPGDEFKGETYLCPGGPEDAELEYLQLPDKKVVARMDRLRKERDAKLAAGAADTWELRKPFQQLYAEQVGDSGLSEEESEDGRLARSAAKLIERLAGQDKPFFLTVGFYATHTPLLAPKKYVDMYDPDKMPLTPAPASKDRNVPMVAKRGGENYDIFNGLYPEYGPTPERQREAIAAYYACASYVDAQIGIVLEALKKNGLAEDTIVIFFSDHGFHLGEHGCWSKFTVFEQSIRVPLIVHVPGSENNGKVCDEIVELVDLPPTLCDLWGVPKPETFESISFVPLLENPDTPWKKGAYTMITLGGLARSVRTKQYRYAEYRHSRAGADSNEKPHAVELYDLEADPFEQVNLADRQDHEKNRSQMRDLLKGGWKAALPE